jgi:hypothetical protein
MDEKIKQIKKQSRQIIVKFPEPLFYSDFNLSIKFSEDFIKNDNVIIKIQDFVNKSINTNFGHGIEHAKKVAIDTAVLMLIEGQNENYPAKYLKKRVRLAQCAGLLHDIKRTEKNHAKKGAKFVKEFLTQYTEFDSFDIRDISLAIENHEAFKKCKKIKNKDGLILSNCLYDADKFRWGPDNFTYTLWDILSCSKTDLSRFYENYNKGIKTIEKIKNTFKTKTGKKYGNEFIDIGLNIGKEIFKLLEKEINS